MKTWKKIVSIFCVLLFAFCLAACEQEGPAERAGEEMDEAVEETAEGIEEAGDEMEH